MFTHWLFVYTDRAGEDRTIQFYHDYDDYVSPWARSDDTAAWSYPALTWNIWRKYFDGLLMIFTDLHREWTKRPV